MNEFPHGLLQHFFNSSPLPSNLTYGLDALVRLPDMMFQPGKELGLLLAAGAKTHVFLIKIKKRKERILWACCT
jgi:hypothetical protein